MEIRSGLRAFRRQAERLFRYWALAAAVAGIVTALIVLLSLPGRGTVSTAVEFSYAGVEAGLDPMGDRFDPGEIRSEEVIRAAVETMGTAPGEETVEQIRKAVSIRGHVPDEALEKALDDRTIYGDDTVAGTASLRDRSYWPTRYTVTLDHAALGWSAAEGRRFLDAMLDRYSEIFYETYGYATALENAVLAIDYNDYDYIDALDVLDSSLVSLRGYLSRLSQEDSAHYVSGTTGHSFSDLIAAIDTVRSEDIHWISAYIRNNDITKDRRELIERYAHRIAEDERKLASERIRVGMLRDLIADYAKTDMVVIGAAGQSGDQGDLPGYEFSQHSEMYDELIQENIEARTTISEIQERIERYTQAMRRLEGPVAASDGQIGSDDQIEAYVEALDSVESGRGEEEVETYLEALDRKIRDLLEDTRTTAGGYFRTVRLQRAFQIVSEDRDWESSPLWRCVYHVLAVEAVLFGAALLTALLRIRRRGTGQGQDADSGMDRHQIGE